MGHPSFIRGTYRLASTLVGPTLDGLLERRARRGKEDRIRLGERRGVASLVRPTGPLVWVHVASVGESLSVLPLVERMLDDNPRLHVLVTSATVTSARLLGSRLPERAFHQFSPLDRPSWVKRFVSTWKPDLAIFVESELWPNLISAARVADCPCILINGRVSERSFKRWQKVPGFISSLLSDFALCLVQDGDQAARFEALGAAKVQAVGNLKMIDGRRRGDQLLVNAEIIDTANRPTWLAASTHTGEEALVLDIHNHLVRRVPGLLTMVALRHPDRRDEVLELLTQRGLRFVTRSSGARVEEDHEVFVIDSIGELPDFYAATDLALICGSLVEGIGGHNPIEALHRDTCVVMGPYVANFQGITRDLLDERAIAQVANVDEAKALFIELLTNASARADYLTNSRKYLGRHRNVIDDSLRALAPHLPQAAQSGRPGDASNDVKVVPLRSA